MRKNLSLIIGTFGICFYVLSLSFWISSKVPMIILSISSFLVNILENKGNTNKLVLKNICLILLFVGSMLTSFIGNYQNSMKGIIFNFPFLPAFLILFTLFIMTESICENIKIIYFFYAAASFTGLVISITSIFVALKDFQFNQINLTIWIKSLGNPNIVVPNDLILLIILAPFSFAIVQAKKNFAFKFLAICSILLALLTVIFYQSRLSLVLAIFSFFMWGIFFKKSNLFFYVLYGFFILILVLFISNIFENAFLLKLLKPWSSRIVYWVIAWQMFIDAPLIGLGPRTFGLLYDIYKKKMQIPDFLNWIDVSDPRTSAWTHNLFLETLAEQGILGLAILVIFLSYGVIQLSKAYLKAIRVNDNKSDNKNNNDNDFKILIAGAFGALLNVCFASVFELSFVRHWVVIILFFILGINNIFIFLLKGDKKYAKN